MNFKLSDITIIFLTLLLFFGLFNLHASAAAFTVTICHATKSATNPYIQETVAVASLGNGHGHNGVNPGDIVPPTPGTDFPNGNNWDATGQAIYNNGCKTPGPTPTPTKGAGPTPTPINTPTPTLTPTPTKGESPTPTPTLTPTPTKGEDPTPTPTLTPTPTKGEDPTPTPTNTPTPTSTPTPTIGEGPTATPTPPTNGGGNGNNCSIFNQLNSTSSTGGNTANGNTGGSTTIVTGNASSQTNVSSQCGQNTAIIHFNCPQTIDIAILGNGAGSNNAVEVTSNQLIKISQ